MNNALNTLAFQANASTTLNVRVFEIDGGPWFVATDVCRALVSIWMAARLLI